MRFINAYSDSPYEMLPWVKDQVIFKWFIPVVCDYNIKYQIDIRWVSQNTTLY